MLKLLSMNLYDLEAGSRTENLVAFKRAYGASMQAVERCLAAHFALSGERAQRFLYAFYPFLFGVYPYTAVTEKQRRAMEIAGVAYRSCTVSELTRAFIEDLIAGFGA